jgi:hypothetical protein
VFDIGFVERSIRTWQPRATQGRKFPLRCLQVQLDVLRSNHPISYCPKGLAENISKSAMAHRLAGECRWSQRGETMNQIIYIVGLVVVVIVILGFFGLR